MKTILAAGFIAGVSTIAAMAEDERRTHGDAIRPHGGEREHPPGGWEKPRKDGDKRPPLGPPQDMFKHMDRDGDGQISKDEFFSAPRMERLPVKQREAVFGRLDRNGDGFLELEEIRVSRRHKEHHMKEDFRKLDADQSGGLDFEEFSKGEFFAKLPEEKRRQIFDRLDTDGNGEINAADKPTTPPERRPEQQ